MELLPALPAQVSIESAAPASRLETIAAGWLSAYGPATRTAYARDLRSWVIWCESHDLDPLDARRAHVQLHARQLEEMPRAPATVARRLAAVAGFYRYAVEEGYLDRSPAAHVRRPRVSEDSPTLGLDSAELLALLEAARASPDTADLALVLLLGLNGLRVSEACGADIADLEAMRGHHVLHLVRKGAKKGQAPLAPVTLAAVEAHVGARQLGPLLLDHRGRRLAGHQATWVVTRLAKTAGIAKHISPHSLRHTFVTLALDAGVALHEVQDAAGHADPRTTMRYNRARNSLDSHATYRLARFLAGAA